MPSSSWRAPRATTVLGMPEIMLKLSQVANPLAAYLMDRFMTTWSQKADPVAKTSGTLYAPPAGPSGVRGGQRLHPPAAKTVLVVGAVAVLAAVGAQLLCRRS